MSELITLFAVFMIAILTGMGVGSGGLLVVYLTLLAGIPQIRAQGINLAFFVLSSGAALLLHLERRRWNVRRILIPCVIGLLFSLIGTRAALVLPESIMRRIFGGMLVLSGLFSLFRKSVKKTEKFEKIP